MNNFTLLLQNKSKDELLEILAQKLYLSDEADFWKEKIIPYADTILTILLQLNEQNLLFNPEGEIVELLNSELFFRWSDLVCLRVLYFILKQSNQKNELVRTKYKNKTYKFIDIEKLENYLFQNRINIIDEDILDFSIATYNLHIGMLTILKNLTKN